MADAPEPMTATLRSLTTKDSSQAAEWTTGPLKVSSPSIAGNFQLLPKTSACGRDRRQARLDLLQNTAAVYEDFSTVDKGLTAFQILHCYVPAVLPIDPFSFSYYMSKLGIIVDLVLFG